MGASWAQELCERGLEEAGRDIHRNEVVRSRWRVQLKHCEDGIGPPAARISAVRADGCAKSEAFTYTMMCP